VVVDGYFFWFADEPLRRFVAAADARRVVFFTRLDRRRFEAETRKANPSASP
jgi:hypothetical protein